MAGWTTNSPPIAARPKGTLVVRGAPLLPTRTIVENASGVSNRPRWFRQVHAGVGVNQGLNLHFSDTACNKRCNPADAREPAASPQHGRRLQRGCATALDGNGRTLSAALGRAVPSQVGLTAPRYRAFRTLTAACGPGAP